MSQNSVLTPAYIEFQNIYESAIQNLPYFLSGILSLVGFLFLGWILRKFVRSRANNTAQSQLASNAIANVAFILVLAAGLIISLRIAGMTGLAFTLVGGTGVIGIGLGLALKGSFENYIAGIILSFRRVFTVGDLVEIGGREGVVQAVNSRSTLIMDLEGNNISIPNSQVYNTVIKNFTNNPKMRADFTIGIGYDDSIDHARNIIMDKFNTIPELILNEPEPMVCVDKLGSATVNLKVYFWFNARKFSVIKMKSMVIQMMKEALMEAEVSMPDDAREVVFTSPLEIKNITENEVQPTQSSSKAQPTTEDFSKKMDLSSETENIKKQLRESSEPETGTNLLK